MADRSASKTRASGRGKGEAAHNEAAHTPLRRGRTGDARPYSNQGLQSLIKQGATSGPQIHEGYQADSILRDLNTRGAAVGQNILLSRSLAGGTRDAVLQHEMRHVAQVSGRNVDMSAPLQIGARGDHWERAAKGIGNPGSGADPQVIRRDDPPLLSSADTAICEAPPQLDADVEAGTCDINEEALLDSSAEPMTSIDSEQLSSELTPPICQLPYADASFDPEMVDIEGMRNDTMNSESIRVDNWVADHNAMSPVHADLGAYRRLQQRLKAERGVRVQNGHLWMTTAVDPTPDELLMLNSMGGETVIIQVHQSIATGVPNESFAGPIMTRQQFNDHMSGMSIPIMTETEYIRRLIDTADQIAPWLMQADVLPTGPMADPNGILFPYADPYLDETALLSGQTAAHTVGGSGLYRSPFSIGAQGAFSDSILAANGSGRELMQWRGGAGEAGYAGTMHAAFGPGTTALNSQDWLNYSYPTPRQQRAAQRNFPVFDFERTSGVSARILGVSRVSVKTSLQADFMRMSTDGRRISGRMGYYADGMRAMLEPDARRSALHNYIRNQPGQAQTAHGTLAYEQVRSDILSTARIAINADDVQATRQMLRQVGDNWQFFQVRPIYSAVLRENPIDVQTSSGTVTIDSAAALDAASISAADRSAVHAHIADHVSELVISSGITTQQAQNLRNARIPRGSTLDPSGGGATRFIHPDMTDAAIDRTITPEFMESSRHGGGVRGTGIASMRNGAQGGVGGGVIAVLTTAGIMLFDEADHPNWERELAQSGGMGALGGFGESAIETGLISYGTRRGLERGGTGMLVREGTRFLPNGIRMSSGLRVGGAGVAGAIVAPIMEGIDMSSDGRENSAEEVVVRTGRAAVIGGSSAVAGAAIGTAIGGPVGFVAGLAIGFGVGLAMEYLVPGGRSDWEQRHREEQERLRRQEAERRRREEQERREAAERARQARLDRPLDSDSASTVGVEGIFSVPTENPLFMASEAGIQPTVGELELEYIATTLRVSPQQLQVEPIAQAAP